MNSDKKIKIFSTIMMNLCLLGIVFNIIMHLFLWWVGGFTVGSEGISITRNIEWLSWKWFGFIINSFNIVFLILALNHLRLFFKQYRLGRYFNLKSSKHFQLFSRFLLATAISVPVTRAVSSFSKRYLLPEQNFEVTVSLSTDDVNFFLVSLIFIGVSWLMLEATKLKQENSSFV